MKKLIKSKLFLQVIVASFVATLATVGIVTATSTIGANISTAGTLNIDSGTLYVGTADRVGIGTTTPFASLSINNIAGDNAFVIGSSTATWLKVDASGLLTVAKGATFSSTLAAGNTTITGTLTADTKIGIASTTPFGQLGVGAGSTATSTISTGKFCMFVADQKGRSYWITLNMDSPGTSQSLFATSTIPCNQ